MILRIAQLSDLHIGDENELTFGANGRQQFEQALRQSKRANPDFIILSGDLCLDEPVAEIYPWVKEKMDAINIPYAVIAGNHDDSVLMADTFHSEELKNEELYYTKRINEHFIVFLDSARGKFSEDQWAWLKDQLHEVKQQAHIVMHHPPIHAGVSFLDKRHAFTQQQQFIDLMKSFELDVHVYCGHYHTSRYIQHGNVHIHICPSTLFQMNAQNPEFEMESTNLGIQLITLKQNRIETQTIWATSEGMANNNGPI